MSPFVDAVNWCRLFVVYILLSLFGFVVSRACLDSAHRIVESQVTLVLVDARIWVSQI